MRQTPDSDDTAIGEGPIAAVRPAASSRPRLPLIAASLLILWMSWPVEYCGASVYSFDWQRTLLPAGSDYVSAAIRHILSDGTLIITSGCTNSNTPSGQVLAYDSKGTLKWSYNTGGYPESTAISVDQATVYAMSTRGVTSTAHTDLYAIRTIDGVLRGKSPLYPAGSPAQPTLMAISRVLSDGTVLAFAGGQANGPASFGKIFAYGPDGALKWSFDAHGTPQIAVSPDQTMVYATATKLTSSGYQANLFAVQANGLLKWQYPMWPGVTTTQGATPPRVLSDGTIIVSAGEATAGSSASGKIVAYDPSGSIRWTYPTQGSPQVMLGPDKATIYATVTKAVDASAGTYEEDLIAVQTNGYPKWLRTLYPAGNRLTVAINRILADGTLILFMSDPMYPPAFGQILAYGPGGAPKWHYDFQAPPGATQVSHDQGTLYTAVTTDISGTYETDLYAFQATGSPEWKATPYPAGSYQVQVFAQPLTDGTLIVGAGGWGADSAFGQVFAYDPGGNVTWSYDTQGYPNVRFSPDQSAIYSTVTHEISGAYGVDLYAFRIFSGLTVTKPGSGSGTVTSVGPGISCGATCSAGFGKGTHVTLFPTADTGSTFTGWSGGGCTGTGTCTVTMTGDITVAATFTLKSFTLRVATQGNGAISAQGLKCSGTSCSGSYPFGSTVSLTATPNQGEDFDHWTGCDTSNGAACTVRMNSASNRTVTGKFTSHNPCTYGIVPTSRAFTWAAGSAAVAITGTGAITDCAAPDVRVSSGNAWISLSPVAFAHHKGSVTVSVTRNDSLPTRTGAVTIQNLSFPVSQTGHYVPPSGCVTGAILPPGAVAAGAKWKLDSGAWRGSGTTVCAIPVGSHKVTFMAIPNWSTPVDQMVTISNGMTSTATGTYSPPIIFAPSNPLGAIWRCGTFGYNLATLSPPSGGAGDNTWTFSLGSMGGSPPLGVTVSPNGLVSGVASSPIGSYPFTVCAVDSNFAQKCRPTSITVTAPLHPGTPTGPTPANGATKVSPGTALRWATAPSKGSTDSSNVYLGTTFPPPYVATVTAPGYSPPDMLSTGTTYYWQVIGKHNMCAGLPPTLAGGPIWSFTTSNISMSLTLSSQTCTQTWCGADYPCLNVQDTITLKGTACGPVGAYIVPGFDVDCDKWYKDGMSCERPSSSYPSCMSFTFSASNDLHGQTRTGDLTLWDLQNNSITKSWSVNCPPCTCP